MTRLAFVLLAATSLIASQAHAVVRITEWMYNGNGEGSIGEFVELTNLGASTVDMTGWSFDDDSRNPGTISLSDFGLVAPGETVVLTDNTAAAFRTDWGLSASVKVIGGNTANLSRNDEINIYDGASLLVDRLAYGDQNFAGTIRTNGVSGNPSGAALGANNPALWAISVAGDSFGSYVAASGDLGNPGRYVIPEPAAAVLCLLPAIAMGRIRRRRRS